jgi:predicted nucleotidyltransferase
MSTELEALFGKTRRAILSLLFSHPDESFHLRRILRSTGVLPGAGQRELVRLSKANLILRILKGQQVHFQANPRCPIFAELKSLITKTSGLVDILHSALGSFGHLIRFAFVYGSFAGGRANKESDVDLLVIGAVGFSDVVEKLGRAQDILGREVNPMVVSIEEFQRRVAEEDHFLRSVLKSDLMFIIGDRHEFNRMAEKRLAS